MLTVTGLTKAYGGRTLFANASLQVNRGDCIGLVGPNGAGKSTLFSLILGTESPDEGRISIARSASVGMLPQETAPVRDESVLELVVSPQPRSLTGAMPESPAGWTRTADKEAIAANQQHFDEAGAYDLEARAKKILHGLGFRNRDFERPLREMSGGWVMRAYLGRLLLQQPDLLMLDEPTNHLDLDALLWFQGYLSSYPGAILTISHDRAFLDRLVGSIVEIRQSKLWRYTGNYEDYLVQREAQEEQLLAAYKNQQREIAHLMEFVNRFRAKNTKASQAQSKLKQIDRMEKIDAPARAERKVNFRFPQPPRSGRNVMTLAGVHHAYGATPVYQGLDFQAERGERMVLVGPNGAGKSTLLKILAGVLPFQGGERILGHNVRVGYYAQYRTEMLDPTQTILEEALDGAQQVSEQFVRTLLGCFLFSGDDVFKKVSVLSGGEKSRLALVKLLLNPPNLLLMDEPTTHLDMASIEALIFALDQFEGTLIFISHDVYFIQSLANQVLHVQDGTVLRYPGSYSYYVEKRAADLARQNPSPDENSAAADVAERPSAKAREQKRREAEARQHRYRKRKSKEEVVARLESEILQLEERQKELTALLENPETYERSGQAVALNRELSDLVERLASLNAQWEQAASELEDAQ